MGLGQVFDDINEKMMLEYMQHWQDLCFDLAHEKGFHHERNVEGVTRDASAGERIMLIVSECVELFESYRELGDPAEAPSELADIVIRCLDYAGVYGINLGEAMMAKLQYNATRPYQHGGKVV